MRYKKYIIGIIFIAALFILCLIFIPIVRNNILLNQYAAQLYRIQLPPNTIKISQDKAVGNFYGTGNHLDFVATIVIQSSLSELDLTTYFDEFKPEVKSVDEISLFGLNTHYPDTDIDHTIQEIEVIPKSQAKETDISSKIYMKDVAKIKDADDDLFIVQIKDTHYAPGWDIRAH